MRGKFWRVSGDAHGSGWLVLGEGEFATLAMDEGKQPLLRAKEFEMFQFGHSDC